MKTHNHALLTLFGSLSLVTLPLYGASTPAPGQTSDHVHADGESCSEDHAQESKAPKASTKEDAHIHVEGEAAHSHEGESKGDGHTHAEGEATHSHEAEAEAKEDTHVHTEGEAAHSHEGESEGDGHTHTEDEATHSHEAEADAHVHADGEPCPGESAPSPKKCIVSLEAQASLALKFGKPDVASTLTDRIIYGEWILPLSSQEALILPMDGKVTLSVERSQKVKKGDILFTLSSPEILGLQKTKEEAQARLERFSLERQALEQRLKKLEDIGTKNSELESSLKFKQAEEKTLAAELDKITSQLDILKGYGSLKGETLTFTADNDGSIELPNTFTNGTFWGTTGSTVLTLTRLNPPLHFKGKIYAGDNTDNKEAFLVVPNGTDTLTLPGTLNVSPDVDQTTRTRTVYIIPQGEALPPSASPGQIIRAELRTPNTETSEYLSVPSSAVIRIGVEDIVFVQNPSDPDEFYAKPVQTLPARQGKTSVKGLLLSDKIVIAGGNELKYALAESSGNTEKSKSAGHFHADGKFHEGTHE